jgi:hypothetical protein
MNFGDKDVHIAHGEIGAVSLHHDLGIPLDRIFLGYDDLSCGPLTTVRPPERWQELRRAYWLEPERAPADADGLPDPSTLYIRLERERSRIEAAERIFLWLGTTLAEQLLLAWLMVVFKHLGFDTGNIRLLDLQPYHGRTLRSIGELNREMISTLCHWRRPREGELASYEAAWLAVSAPSPKQLIAFCGAEAAHPKATGAALRAFMGRYPTAGTGLNYWDRELLENCQENRQKAARIVGETILPRRDVDYPDWPGDLYLFERLKRLGDDRRANPLVALVGDPSAMRFMKASITETGRRVLAAEANFVELNGVDEWVGGVHLSSNEGKLWYFDGQTLVPRRKV